MSPGSVSPYDEAESPEPGTVGPVVSEHSRGVALALAVVGGPFGLHRFYTGRTQSGIWMIVTLGGAGLWWLYDMIVIVAGDFRDVDGRRLAHWKVSDTVVAPLSTPADARVADLEDRLLGLESQVGELAERLDFAERLLAKARERGPLQKG